jgi:hypothetical protein
MTKDPRGPGLSQRKVTHNAGYVGYLTRAI